MAIILNEVNAHNWNKLSGLSTATIAKRSGRNRCGKLDLLDRLVLEKD